MLYMEHPTDNSTDNNVDAATPTKKPRKPRGKTAEQRRKQERKARQAAREAGRPKQDWLSYSQAQQIVKSEEIKSVSEFRTWHAKIKPGRIPARPERVYQEWISWNDFLGTSNNMLSRAVHWRPWNQAVAWVHTLGLKSQDEWREWIKQQGANKPADIPTNPDVAYPTKWLGWAHWLGSSVQAIVQVKRNNVRTRVFYMVRVPGVPSNIITFGIEELGLAALKEKCVRENLTILQLFWCDNERLPQVKKYIDAMSSPYYGDDRQRLVPNVAELIWRIQTEFESIRGRELSEVFNDPPKPAEPIRQDHDVGVFHSPQQKSFLRLV